ncbi:MAG TPA: ribonuclease D [Dehalococcoidia bacterium]|jgi:ribonuclease D|nr:ribonuclease D [Dehalococcoidia bacterium]
MPLILVDTPPALAACLERLRTAQTLAIDTEADSFHSYFHRTCLLQISSEDVDYVLDPLVIDPMPLGPLFADPGVEKIMHAAENDIRALKRDYGFSFRTLFDTMVAARLLGYPRWGLADLLRDAFGVELDKRYQRFDWSQRPLPAPALQYAALDTHYLPALRDRLHAELEQRGLLEEAEDAFAALEQTPPAESGFDPEDFWRVKGAYDLEAAQRPALRELYKLRDDLARRSNRPPFRVLADATLIALARTAPRDQRALEQIPGMTPYLVQRFGRAILAALARAEAMPPIAVLRTRRDDAAMARYDALRAWRNARAAARHVEGDVILGNSVLRALAAAPPRDRGALSASGLLSPWKLKTYGDEILAVLARQR